MKNESQMKQGIISDNYWIINDYLTKIVMNDEDLLKKIVMLFGYYIDIPEDMLNWLILEEYFNLKERKIINNEILRSNPKVQISNFYIYMGLSMNMKKHVNIIYQMLENLIL